MRNVPNFGDTCKAILDAVMDEMDAENCSLTLKESISGDLAICAATERMKRKVCFTQIDPVTGKDSNQEKGLQVGS